MTLDDVTKNVKIQRVSCIISSGCPDIRSFFSVDFLSPCIVLNNNTNPFNHLEYFANLYLSFEAIFSI